MACAFCMTCVVGGRVINVVVVMVKRVRFASKELGPTAKCSKDDKEEDKVIDDEPHIEDDDINKDPYYLEEAEYINSEHRWRNRQRVLIFGSRGITSRYRHVMEDIKRMCVHSKSEPKFEKKQRLQDLKEICELKSCNNCIYFECRKSQYCYMWMSCMPNGPTAKFQVYNVHTLGEMRLTGNCLNGSRPLLHFDKAFDNNEYPQLSLYKQMFIKMFGIPRNHPKSKPFYDHIMSFYWLDNKIWIRHYQISPESNEVLNNPNKQTLTEIGPRMVLEPILILAGSFSGDVIYRNIRYESPTEIRRQMKRVRAVEHEAKVVENEKSKMRKVAANLQEDDLDEIFGKNINVIDDQEEEDEVDDEEEEE